MHQEVLRDRPQRIGRKEGQRADDQDHPDHQDHEQRPSRRKSAAGGRGGPLRGHGASDGHDRHEEEEAADGRSEGPGLNAIAEGFRHLGLKDDHEILEREFIVYDALYAYCQQKVKQQ